MYQHNQGLFVVYHHSQGLFIVYNHSQDLFVVYHRSQGHFLVYHHSQDLFVVYHHSQDLFLVYYCSQGHFVVYHNSQDLFVVYNHNQGLFVVYLFSCDDGTRLSETVFFLWSSSIVLIFLTVYGISEVDIRSVEDDGQSLRGEYCFTNSFFLLLLLRRLLVFLLPVLQKNALIQTYRFSSSFSHVVLRIAASLFQVQLKVSVGHVDNACLC